MKLFVIMLILVVIFANLVVISAVVVNDDNGYQEWIEKHLEEDLENLGERAKAEHDESSDH